MSLVIQSIVTIFLLIIMYFAVVVITKSVATVKDTWEYGVDVRVTGEKLYNNFFGSINLIALKSPNDIYLNGSIVGRIQSDKLELFDKKFLFRVVMTGDATGLKSIKVGDIIENGKQRYEVIEIPDDMMDSTTVSLPILNEELGTTRKLICKKI